MGFVFASPTTMSHSFCIFFLSYKGSEEPQGRGPKELAGSVRTVYWDTSSLLSCPQDQMVQTAMSQWP